MRQFVADADRGGIAALAAIGLSLSLFAFVVVNGLPAQKVAPVVLLTVAAALGYRTLLAWRTLLVVMILVILFIPIRRYAMPGNLPFDLEPYRLCVALVGAAWVTSLLIDSRVRLRRSGLDWPLAALIAAVLASVVTNGDRIHDLAVGAVVTKKLTFLLSFLLVFYLVVSLVRTRKHRDALIRVLVGGGAFVALLALYEARTHNNLFNNLATIIPVLELTEVPSKKDLARAGRLRTYASAQHPIALGTAMVILFPLSVYVARATRQWRWYAAAALIVLGALASLSRTSIIMLAVVAIVFLRHRPRETKSLWPLLLPGLLAVHFALPGAIGTFHESFFPKGGLIAEQKKSAGSVGSGRVADLGPSLSQWEKEPLFGYGYGTRVVEGKKANAMILDDQWLGILLETGLAGALAWLWLFLRFIRRLSRKARGDPTPHGWLLTAVVASVSAFAFSMLTYDAFGFIQATFLLFIVLAIGCAAVTDGDGDGPRAAAGAST